MGRAFQGGTIHTLDPGRPTAGRVVVRDGRVDRVEAAGTGRAAGEGVVEAFDLDGRAMLPGFIDAHIHLSQVAREESFLDLAGVRGLDDVEARLEERPRGETGEGWRRGRGLPGALAEEIVTSARALASGRGPTLIATHDLHAALVNRRGLEALEAQGVLSGVPGRCVLRWAEGALLRERAAFAAARAVDRLGGPVGEEALARTVAGLNARGVTGVFTFERTGDARGIGGSSACRRGLAVAAALYDEDAGALEGDAGAKFGRAGLKIFLDGALGSRSAWMIEPYGDTGGCGIEVTPVRRRRELARQAVQFGVPVCLHAIGDAAARAAVDLLEEIGPLDASLSGRHRVEHVQLLRPEDLDRWEHIGGVACLQPLHLPADREGAERAWGARCRDAYPQRRLRERGLRLAFGSDAPAGESDPLEAIRMAVARRTASGVVVEGAWCRGERIDTEAAFAAHTRDAAFASGLAAGRIRAGLRADLVVLSHDPFASEADLMRAEVVATVVAGEIVTGADRLRKVDHP